VEESYADHEALAIADEPGFGQYTIANKASWITPVMEEFDGGKRSGQPKPYYVGAGLSQWRKIWLTLRMVQDSGIDYSIVIRARPDHMFAAREPLDLRALSRDYRSRPMTQRARGHFFAVAERHHCEPYPDHFGLGSLAALMQAFARPLPYEAAGAETYMVKNLAMRCLTRNIDVLKSEFVGGERGVDAVGGHRHAPGTERNLFGYSVIPDSMRASKFSPVINCGSAVPHPGMGSEFCIGPGSRCIPAYRLVHTYLYNTVTSTFVARGSVCIGRYSGEAEEKFLLWAGIANASDPVGAQKYGFGPCLRIPVLAKPWRKLRKWFKSLPKADKRGLLQHGV
jgi:hypothetical protein